jgi:hypothetical protein
MEAVSGRRLGGNFESLDWPMTSLAVSMDGVMVI